MGEFWEVFRRGLKRVWDSTVWHVKEGIHDFSDALGAPKAEATIALIFGCATLILGFLAWQFPTSVESSTGTTQQTPSAPTTASSPKTAAPTNLTCPYDLSIDTRTEAFPDGFDVGAVIEQNIDKQLEGLKSIASIDPVTDYDWRGIKLATLEAVTVQLLEDGRVIRSETYHPAEFKTVPAAFNFKEVKIDHSKSYKFVVKNTTGQNIAIWMNQAGPSRGYQKVLVNGETREWSLSGKVCGIKKG
jgi:hypothetical protein